MDMVEDLIRVLPMRSSWGVILAAYHSTADLQTQFGLLIVLACLVAAGVAAWRAVWAAAGALLVVAIVTAFLLL